MVRAEENEIIEGDDGVIYQAQTVQRKKKIKEDQMQYRAKQKREQVESRKNPDLQDKIKRAEKFIMERREIQKNFVNQKKRKFKNLDIDDEISNKIVLAVRLRGNKNQTEKQKVCHKLLKLKKVHDAVIFKASNNLIKSLKICEPFLTYGFPTREIISQMVHKRAYCKIANEYQPLKSNAIVEEHLAQFGLICIEDIVIELFKGGKNIEDVREFLGAFKMTKPHNGYGDKTKPYKNGGAWGFRGAKINDLVKTMI